MRRLDKDERLTIAVALNGRIAAVTQTFARGGPDRDTQFLAMLPPDAFRSGANVVSLYDVEDEPDGFILRPLRWAPR